MVDSRRSILGYVLLLGKSTISWKLKKQRTVSSLNSKVEHLAMDVDVCEVTRVIRLLHDVREDGVQPATLHSDNQSTISIAKNPFFP